MVLWSSGTVSVGLPLLGSIVQDFGSFMQHDVFITFFIVTHSFYTL